MPARLVLTNAFCCPGQWKAFAVHGLCTLAAVVTCLEAQQSIATSPYWQEETGYVALQQSVLDAASDTSVLLVAAHPDDRYMLPAAYLRFHHGFRVAAILFTRGKGGQNSRGPETGDELGRLRTLESEACAAQLGLKLYYLNRLDSGYSRSAQETLEQWGKDSTIQDLARLIRRIQPDIVMTTHHPGEDHGHDAALLEVLPDAVRMSGDPAFETEGLPAFQVSRLFRSATAGEEDRITVSLPMDDMEHLRGDTYRSLAYKALKKHRSQQPQQPMRTLFEPMLEMVSLEIEGQPHHTSLEEGLPDLFSALRGTLSSGQIKQLRQDAFGRLRQSLGSLPDLARRSIELRARLLAIPAVAGSQLERRLGRRTKALEKVILQSAGVQIFMEEPPDTLEAPGDDMPLNFWIRNEGCNIVRDLEIKPSHGGQLRLEGPGKSKTILRSGESLALNALYRPPKLEAEDLRRIFAGDTYEHPQLEFRMTVDGQPICLRRFIPTEPQPAVELRVTPRTLLIPSGATGARFVVGIERKTSRTLDLKLRINPPAEMTVERAVRQVRLAEMERFTEFTFTLRAPHVQPGVSMLFVHLGTQRLSVRVHKVDVSVSEQLRVGLIPGVDTTAKGVLNALIGENRLQEFEKDQPIPILDHRRFHTIVVDIRALRSPTACMGFARLLDFVKEGGRLVVFYHKDVEFNLEDAGFRGAPYDLHIGKGRVTQEDAPIRVLQPEHALFNRPNKILAQDWDGWKQERGLYFPETYAKEYVELLEMNDPGQPKERGSLLYARYGKGEYIYCALALYRQLKNRHPGACRLFANLISADTNGEK